MGSTGLKDGFLSGLSERQRMVLRAVVTAYVAQAAPASSATVSHLLPVPLSSASIRNTMADLSALGLIEKPHASAGRIPTDGGLRIFVEQLLGPQPLADFDRRSLSQECEELSGEGMTRWVSQLLSERTHQLGFVVTPRVERVPMRHVSFVRVARDKLLAVLVPEAGPIQQREIEDLGTGDQRELDAVAARLNERLPGHTLGEMRSLLEGELSDLRSEARGIYTRTAELGLQAFAATPSVPGDLVITTRSALLNQPEFNDPDRTRAIFEAVETNRRLLEVIGRVLERPGDEVRVSLGEDLDELGLRHCAMVAISYGARSGAEDSETGATGGDQPLGVLGVIGPNRMDYGRVIPLVHYCSHLVTEKLLP
ncbi:MAG: heat-inducible transcriptional repressor HrcA [Myxococcota bacterium]|jgi:heat-inducible transcriptional repressor|nr:heat-inducible transcriptional repressor HrcA [Myxococcota bacterium]